MSRVFHSSTALSYGALSSYAFKEGNLKGPCAAYRREMEKHKTLYKKHQQVWSA